MREPNTQSRLLISMASVFSIGIRNVLRNSFQGMVCARTHGQRLTQGVNGRLYHSVRRAAASAANTWPATRKLLGVSPAVGRPLGPRLASETRCGPGPITVQPSEVFSTQAAHKRWSPKLLTVTRDESAGWYRVGLENGFEGTYPFVWLRDNCRCSECYHPSSWQRTFQIADLDVDVVPTSEALLDDGRVLSITWPDQHRSDFDAAWLNRQRFSEMERDTVSSPELEMWGGELTGNIPMFEFEKLLQNDMELYNWLSVLNSKGLSIVKDAPKRKGAGRQLAERVAYLKTTIYGEDFQVFSKQDASNLAYTPKSLCLHIDLPFYNYTPGIQMLHCIEQANATGGENQLVDGLYVAEQVRKEFPDTYDLLRTQEIDFRDAGIDYRVYHLKMKRPLIEYNKYGEFKGVNYNDHVRAPYLSLPVDKVTEMYRAIKQFREVMYRPGNFVEHRLAAGEIVTFNNGRVLHGRSAYTITGEGTRHLEGGYMDWDEAHSRMRILRESIFGDVRL